MREIDAPTLAHLQSRGGIIVRILVWFIARDRGTGLPVPIGLWTGLHDATITVEGEERLYHGAGTLLAAAPLVYEIGLGVRMQTVSLSLTAPEAIEAVRGHDVRLAPVEIHRQIVHPASEVPVAAPHRLFRGTVDKLSLPRPAQGGAGVAEATLAPSTRALTRTLALKKSDESQRLRSDDRFRRYADVSKAKVWWAGRQVEPRSEATSTSTRLPVGPNGAGGQR